MKGLLVVAGAGGLVVAYLMYKKQMAAAPAPALAAVPVPQNSMFPVGSGIMAPAAQQSFPSASAARDYFPSQAIAAPAPAPTNIWRIGPWRIPIPARTTATPVPAPAPVSVVSRTTTPAPSSLYHNPSLGTLTPHPAQPLSHFAGYHMLPGRAGRYTEN